MWCSPLLKAKPPKPALLSAVSRTAASPPNVVRRSSSKHKFKALHEDCLSSAVPITLSSQLRELIPEGALPQNGVLFPNHRWATLALSVPRTAWRRSSAKSDARRVRILSKCARDIPIPAPRCFQRSMREDVVARLVRKDVLIIRLHSFKSDRARGKSTKKEKGDCCYGLSHRGRVLPFLFLFS
jgi:hypothetical protein